jgi:RNA polymerase sigma factor (sigma-70 family)
MLTVAMSLLGDVNSAEDVVQDVFVRFAESLSGFELRGSLKAFLATCVANRSRNLMRQTSRQANTVARFENTGSTSTGSPLDLVLKHESLSRLQGALLTLPPEQREILILKTQGGLSFRALARELNLSLGTVQSRYRYGLDRLRSLMNGEVRK